MTRWDLEHKEKFLPPPRLGFSVKRKEALGGVSGRRRRRDEEPAATAASGRGGGPPQGPRPQTGAAPSCGDDTAARGRSRGTAPPGVARPPRPGVITRAPPPRRRLPPSAGHVSGNRALLAGCSDARVVRGRRRPPLSPPSGLSDAASGLERGRPRGP